jgi:hypothetical protein
MMGGNISQKFRNACPFGNKTEGRDGWYSHIDHLFKHPCNGKLAFSQFGSSKYMYLVYFSSFRSSASVSSDIMFQSVLHGMHRKCTKIN